MKPPLRIESRMAEAMGLVVLIFVLASNPTLAYNSSGRGLAPTVGGASSITLGTSYSSYDGSESVHLTGTIASTSPVAGSSVEVSVVSPGGVTVERVNASLSASGSFSATFEPGQGSAWRSGTYVATATYGASTAETTFTLNEAPFSIFWITDTQYLPETNEPLFANTTQWIVDNWGTYNGKMVVDTGDIVQDPDATGEWENASTAMSVLLSNGVPYTWDAGNHDILNLSSPNWLGSEYQAFNPAIVSRDVDGTGYSGWVGSFDNGMDTAVSFTADGMGFLIVNIEFNGNSTVLAWVDGLLNNPLYANDHVIVATHAYIDSSGNTDDSEWGPLLFNFTTGLTSIMDNHPNVFLTMNGHYESQVGFHQLSPSAGYYDLMFNRQECVDSEGCAPTPTNPPDYLKDGAATVTILTFEPESDQIAVRTFAVDMGVWLTDQWDQYTLSPTFPQPPRAGPDTILFFANSASPTTVGADHGIMVSATDTSSVSYVVVVFATYRSGTSIYVAEGTGIVNLGQVTTVFVVDLQNVPAGTYNVTFCAATTGDIPISEPIAPVSITT